MKDQQVKGRQGVAPTASRLALCRGRSWPRLGLAVPVQRRPDEVGPAGADATRGALKARKAPAQRKVTGR